MPDLVFKVEMVADGVVTRAADREPEPVEAEQDEPKQGAEPSEDEGATK